MNKPQDLLDNTEFIIQEGVSFSALRQRVGRERGEQAFKADDASPGLHLQQKEEREEKAKGNKSLFYQQVDFAEVKLSSQQIRAVST